MTRRTALLGASAGMTGLATTPTLAQTSGRKTFLLIHGAYHGGWCWRPVTDILEHNGHKVYAPSLTGNADRTHLLSKDVNLDTQISDIVNLVAWEGLKDVCLVAHSFGGWPASGALERIHDRVASIVWLDAFKPKNGEKAVDYISEFSRKALEEAVARGEAGRKPPPAKTYSINERHYAWIDSKLAPQPNGVAIQPIKLTGRLDGIARKTYVRAPKYPQAGFDRALAECKSDRSWQTLVNDNSGHDVMIDQPEWLADLLLKVS
ncbi:MAG TPA: alpha/beta hydrolase family protein [Xanthobacteraceae bacterium]|jgi:pimeloyl-ACP methyl ester carboxylesterase